MMKRRGTFMMKKRMRGKGHSKFVGLPEQSLSFFGVPNSLGHGDHPFIPVMHARPPELRSAKCK
jgi:hypothetical protein